MIAKIFVDTMPLWLVFVVTFGLVWLFTELGYHAGVVRSRRPDFDDEQRINVMTATNLGMVGFILVFSFNLAANHYVERKRLVLTEVNAIGTAYLRADLVPADIGTEVQSLLRDYVALRASVEKNYQQLPALIAQTELIQQQLWREMDKLGDLSGFSSRDALLVSAINEVLDLHSIRMYAAFDTRVPASIWNALYAILALSMFGMGYYSGINGRRSSVSRLALTLSMSTVVFLIADLDRPHTGLVRGDQSAMVKFNAKLQTAPEPGTLTGRP